MVAAALRIGGDQRVEDRQAPTTAVAYVASWLLASAADWSAGGGRCCRDSASYVAAGGATEQSSPAAEVGALGVPPVTSGLTAAALPPSCLSSAQPKTATLRRSG